MINKSVDVSEFKVVDAEQGLVEAFVNTMEVIDSDGDIIDKSAFNNSIATGLPIPVLAGHDQSQIVGKVLSARPVHVSDEEYRLYSLMQFNLETQTGKETFSNVRGNFVNQWSVGFNVPTGGWEIEGEGKEQIRRIKDLDWAEVSSVIRGASPSTQTISAKNENTEVEIGISEENITIPSQEVEKDANTVADVSDTEDSASDTQLARAKILLEQARLSLKYKKPKKRKK